MNNICISHVWKQINMCVLSFMDEFACRTQETLTLTCSSAPRLQGQGSGPHDRKFRSGCITGSVGAERLHRTLAAHGTRASAGQLILSGPCWCLSSCRGRRSCMEIESTETHWNLHPYGLTSIWLISNTLPWFYAFCYFWNFIFYFLWLCPRTTCILFLFVCPFCGAQNSFYLTLFLC